MGVWTPGPGPTTGDDVFDGDGTNENVSGGDGADTLNGNGGNDTLNGDSGNDTLNGGLGIDTINGGAGDDIINWLWGDGNGAIDGGADSDTFNITGTAASNILKVNFNGSVLVAAAGNTLANIEIVNAAMGGGGDLLEYVASSAATVNLATSTASGFASLSGIAHVTGGGGNDTITGDANVNKLSGGDGDDTLSGGDGLDTLNGGNGADTIYGGLGNDSVDGGAGNDSVFWNWGDGGDTINGGADFDTVTFVGTGASNLFKIAFDGTRITSVMGNPLSNVEAVVANTGGGGDWLIYKSATTAINVNLAAGAASGLASFSGVSHVQGGTGNDIFTGDSFFNKLDGGDGADTLSAGADNDVLTGGNGNDTLTGGAGIDAINGGDGDDTIFWSWNDGGDSVDGGAGSDTITFTGDGAVNLIKASWNGSVLTQVMSSTLTSVETVNAVGGGGADWLIYTATSGVTANLTTLTASGFASIAGFANLQGGVGNDTLTGDGGANKLLGGAGDDTLAGEAGNDIIDGGADTDTLTYVSAAAGVLINLQTTAAQNTVGAGTDTISNVENLIGSAFDDTLQGNASANTLTGGDGADTLNGGTGADTMTGGIGNDAYYVDDVGDSVSELGGDGVDTVNSSVSFTLANGVENLTLTGVGDINGAGNGAANTIIGNDGANTLTSNGGADTLSGMGGDDILELNVFLSGAAGSVDGGGGTDTLRLNSSGGDYFLWTWTLTSIEQLSITSSAFYYISPEAGLPANLALSASGTGSTATLSIYRGTTGGVVSVDLSGWTFTNWSGTLNIFGDAAPGNTSADTLIGSTRGDAIFGNGGGDTINGNGGNDQISGGDGDDIASGGAGVDSLTGGNGADTLNGDADNDTLTGDAGADTLDGGTGADTMTGGVGNDAYYVDDVGDSVSELGGDGVDTVNSSVSFTLANGVENLTLTGVGDINGAGNGAANTIIGNDGANTLTSNGGADTLSGMGGDDILELNVFLSGAAGSVDGGGGTDTLRLNSSGGDYFLWTWTLTSIEQLSITSSAFYYISPEAVLPANLAVSASGTGASATLSIYRPTGGAVSVDLSGWTFTNWSGTLNIFGDTAGASADTLIGSSQVDTIFGNGGADTINGNGGADQISGGDGDDIVSGGAGNDSLTGGLGADIFVYAAGAGADTISDFDPDAAGGQDLIDITAFGITAGDFGARVTITDLGSSTLVTIDGSVTITLTGVTGDDDNVITSSDFLLV